MSSISNDQGRALEFCITKYILDNLPSINTNSTTLNQQKRDQNKYDTLPNNLKKLFDKAAQQYFSLLPQNIISLRRLSDSEGTKGNPTDIEIKYRLNNIELYKNISIKNNHNAVKHQRPGGLLKQLGIVDKKIDAIYKSEIKVIEKNFFTHILNAGFTSTTELFANIKLNNETIITNLYREICSLVSSTINTYSSTNAQFLFHFLVSELDIEKVIIDSKNQQLIIEDWYELPTPTRVSAHPTADSYINLEFDNGFHFSMRIHTASSKFTVNKTLSLKFDTRLISNNIPYSTYPI